MDKHGHAAAGAARDEDACPMKRRSFGPAPLSYIVKKVGPQKNKFKDAISFNGPGSHSLAESLRQISREFPKDQVPGQSNLGKGQPRSFGKRGEWDRTPPLLCQTHPKTSFFFLAILARQRKALGDRPVP